MAELGCNSAYMLSLLAQRNQFVSHRKAPSTSIPSGHPMDITLHSVALRRGTPAFIWFLQWAVPSGKYATLIGRTATSIKSSGISVAFRGRPMESCLRSPTARPATSQLRFTCSRSLRSRLADSRHRVFLVTTTPYSRQMVKCWHSTVVHKESRASTPCLLREGMSDD